MIVCSTNDTQGARDTPCIDSDTIVNLNTSSCLPFTHVSVRLDQGLPFRELVYGPVYSSPMM